VRHFRRGWRASRESLPRLNVVAPAAGAESASDENMSAGMDMRSSTRRARFVWLWAVLAGDCGDATLGARDGGGAPGHTGSAGGGTTAAVHPTPDRMRVTRAEMRLIRAAGGRGVLLNPAGQPAHYSKAEISRA
jgi:hypothetical protein